MADMTKNILQSKHVCQSNVPMTSSITIMTIVIIVSIKSLFREECIFSKIHKPVGHTMFTGKARETKRIPDFYLHAAILKRFPRTQCSSLSSATQCLSRLCLHSCWRAAGYSLRGIGWSKEDMEPYVPLCQSQKQKSCAMSSQPLFL